MHPCLLFGIGAAAHPRRVCGSGFSYCPSCWIIDTSGGAVSLTLTNCDYFYKIDVNSQSGMMEYSFLNTGSMAARQIFCSPSYSADTGNVLTANAVRFQSCYSLRWDERILTGSIGCRHKSGQMHVQLGFMSTCYHSVTEYPDCVPRPCVRRCPPVCLHCSRSSSQWQHAHQFLSAEHRSSGPGEVRRNYDLPSVRQRDACFADVCWQRPEPDVKPSSLDCMLHRFEQSTFWDKHRGWIGEER